MKHMHYFYHEERKCFIVERLKADFIYVVYKQRYSWQGLLLKTVTDACVTEFLLPASQNL